jgi:hypothetical protein
MAAAALPPHQAGATVELPVINISHSTPQVGKRMIEAAAKYGFLYIDTRGTEFGPHVVERQFELVSFPPMLLVAVGGKRERGKDGVLMCRVHGSRRSSLRPRSGRKRG